MQKAADEMRISDWSSDVCSSDLSVGPDMGIPAEGVVYRQRAELGHDGVGVVGARGLDGLQIVPHRAINAFLQERGRFTQALLKLPETGRASCRESVCQYV